MFQNENKNLEYMEYMEIRNTGIKKNKIIQKSKLKDNLKVLRDSLEKPNNENEFHKLLKSHFGNYEVTTRQIL